MIVFLLTVVAAVAAPAPGHLLLQVSPNTEVVVLPRTREKVAEIALYANRIPVEPQMAGRSARWVRDMTAQGVGGGISFVTVALERPDIEVSWRFDSEGSLLLSFAPGKPRLVDWEPYPTLESLMNDDLPRRPEAPMGRSLLPLPGDGLTTTLDVSRFPLPSGKWSPGRVPASEARFLAVAEPSSWEAMDGYRQLLGPSSSSVANRAALHALSKAYFDRKMPRDALAYVNRLIALPGDFDRGPLYLERARAAVQTGRFEMAREACKEAYDAGVEHTGVLICVGLVSLATSSPPPTETGRALAAISDAPHVRLLAGELLMLDNRHAEALPLLLDLHLMLPGKDGRVAAMNLADAHYASGDYDRAEMLWRDVGSYGELGRIATVRSRMVRMLTTQTSKWVAHIPDLHDIGSRYGPAAAEAHYLVAQIAAVYDDQDLATQELGLLVDRYGALASRGDVMALLHERCVDRMEQLVREGRQAAEAATYADCWRPEFKNLSPDVAPMDRVARAFEDMGLLDRALKAHLDALAVESLHGEPPPERLLHLIRLYGRLERFRDALDTVEYARRYEKQLTPGLLDLLDGSALMGLEREDAAVIAWLAAAKHSESEVEARLRLALLYASTGRCDEARPTLEAVRFVPEAWRTPNVGADAIHLAHSRCLIGDGLSTEAMAAAVRATAEATDPWVHREASHLAVVAAIQDGGAIVPEEVGSLNPVWTKLLDEERLNAAFEMEIQQRR